MKAQTLLRAAAAVFVLATAQAAAMPARAAEACGAGQAHLNVFVEGLRSAKGLITFTLYPDARKKFLAKGGSLLRLRVDAKAPVTEACVELPSPGAYLLAVYHDEDGDRKLGRSLIGIPREGYGFSNNAPASLGLPSFDAVRFTAKAGETDMHIRLRYPTGKEKLPNS